MVGKYALLCFYLCGYQVTHSLVCVSSSFLADFAVFPFHVVVLWSDMLGSVQCWEDPLPRSASS